MKTISTGKAFNELDSKELGKWGERMAIKYIEKIGLTVVDTNYRTRLGEIDIIAKRDLIYHFIEIKARRGMKHGLAREAVTKKKQKHIKRAAMLFLYDLHQKRRRWKELSFDVIEVYLHEDFQSSMMAEIAVLKLKLLSRSSVTFLITRCNSRRNANSSFVSSPVTFFLASSLYASTIRHTRPKKR